jgi:hypothetical protein
MGEWRLPKTMREDACSRVGGQFVIYPFWGSLLSLLYQRVSAMYRRCINSVSVFPHFRVPDTSVSDTYQECILHVSVVYQ